MAKWYLGYNGKKEGPFDDDEASLRAHQNPDGFVWKEGFIDWVPISEISLFSGNPTTSDSPPQIQQMKVKLQCAVHPEMEAIGKCRYCGRDLCDKCLISTKSGHKSCKDEDACLNYQETCNLETKKISEMISARITDNDETDNKINEKPFSTSDSPPQIQQMKDKLQCAVHPEMEAIGKCRNCGRDLCGICLISTESGHKSCKNEDACLNYQETCHLETIKISEMISARITDNDETDNKINEKPFSTSDFYDIFNKWRAAVLNGLPSFRLKCPYCDSILDTVPSRICINCKSTLAQKRSFRSRIESIFIAIIVPVFVIGLLISLPYIFGNIKKLIGDNRTVFIFVALVFMSLLGFAFKAIATSFSSVISDAFGLTKKADLFASMGEMYLNLGDKWLDATAICYANYLATRDLSSARNEFWSIPYYAWDIYHRSTNFNAQLEYGLRNLLFLCLSHSFAANDACQNLYYSRRISRLASDNKQQIELSKHMNQWLNNSLLRKMLANVIFPTAPNVAKHISEEAWKNNFGEYIIDISNIATDAIIEPHLRYDCNMKLRISPDEKIYYLYFANRGYIAMTNKGLHIREYRGSAGDRVANCELNSNIVTIYITPKNKQSGTGDIYFLSNAHCYKLIYTLLGDGIKEACKGHNVENIVILDRKPTSAETKGLHIQEFIVC